MGGGQAGYEGKSCQKPRVPGAVPGWGRPAKETAPGAGGWRLLRAPAPSHHWTGGGQCWRLLSPGARLVGIWWDWPQENRRLRLRAAASTYPTCHRLLQRAWGGHLRGRRHLEQAGHRSGRLPRPSLPTGRGQASAPSPRLTGPKGRSCLLRSPAPPVGTGVSWAGARRAQTRRTEPEPSPWRLT